MSLESNLRSALGRRNDSAPQAFREALYIRPRWDFYGSFVNAGGRLVHSQRFLQLPAVTTALTSFTNPVTQSEMVTAMTANHDWMLVGTSASNDDVTFYAEGGIKCETDGGANDQVIVTTHTGASISQLGTVTWGTDQEPHFQAHIKTGADIDEQIVWAGLKLTNTSTTATDNDQVFFRYQNGVNSGYWQAVYSIGGVDTEVDSGLTNGIVAVAAGASYRLRIVVDSSRVAYFYIGAVLVATSTALTNATDLIPFVGVQNTSTNARHMYVRGVDLSRNYA